MSQAARCETILLTGGAASGKSRFAGALALHLPAPRYFIDAARPDPFDAERPAMRARMASAGFTGIPCARDLANLALPGRGTAVLECLCHLLDNEMFSAGDADPVGTILAGLAALQGQCAALICVTNEIGCGCEACDAATVRYIAALGRLNAAAVKRSDRVYEMVAGIPLLRKGTEP